MPQQYSYELRIPKERVAVLIGKNGETKESLEQETKVKIAVDSKEGEVSITGEDALSLFTVREIIRAIGRGFNPEIARLLLKPDYCFELLSLNEIAKGKSDLLRIKGRIIGAEGKSRRLIEELTESYICVYGKTVGIIGEPENVSMAKRAIESLISGSPHSSVYRWLERKRRELKRQEILGKNKIELKG